jgi:multisubunit Na+/H+ antiporter MnhE subunit
MKEATRRSAQALVLCLALMLFWVACVAGFATHELLLGIPSALVATWFSFYAIRQVPIRFRPTLMDLLEAWRLPGYIARDVVVVLRVLARDLAGPRAPSLFRSAPWRANSRSPRDVARRTLAVAYATVSPNCVVVGIDRKQGQILFHQLEAAPVSEMTQRLGAGAEE